MEAYATTYSKKLHSKRYEARALLRHVHRNNIKRASSCWCAAIYLEDKAYGGPEEGGWWYNCGSLVIASYAPLPIWWKAGQKRHEDIAAMWAWCDEENEGRPSISSVLSEGRYCVTIFRNDMPAYWPKKRPYYS